MMVTGIRGAIVVEENTRESIFAASQELLARIIEANDLQESDVAGIFFTATSDLDAEFPAYVLREIGWRNTAALCAHEIDVPGAMRKVIRIMMFVNMGERRRVHHQYIREARALRPDLAGDE